MTAYIIFGAITLMAFIWAIVTIRRLTKALTMLCNLTEKEIKSLSDEIIIEKRNIAKIHLALQQLKYQKEK